MPNYYYIHCLKRKGHHMMTMLPLNFARVCCWKASITTALKRRRTLPIYLLLLAASSAALHAQGFFANAQLSSQSAGGGLFDYTLSLDNAANSPNQIETFWYAWVPGQNYLPTSPASVQPPTGWTDNIIHIGAGDGYSIRFTTSTTPVTPGSSLDFKFTSTDTPAALAGDSPYYPTTPVGTSFLYSGAPFSGVSQQFLVQPVPEPGSASLLLGGGLIAVAFTRKNLLCLERAS